jgi:hypothetical protein
MWVLLAIATMPALGQQPAGSPTELQRLRNDLKQIEARIDALEAAEKAAAVAGASPAASGVAAEPAVSIQQPPTQAQPAAATGADAVKQAEDKGMDTMDAGMGGETIDIPHIPQMKLRGFGDVRASG